MSSPRRRPPVRDSFGAPKNSNRTEVMGRYQLVFRHDRAGRLVDAQEFKRLRLPQARFIPCNAPCRLTLSSNLNFHAHLTRRAGDNLDRGCFITGVEVFHFPVGDFGDLFLAQFADL